MKYFLFFILCFLTLKSVAETSTAMLIDVENPKIISLKEAASLALQKNFGLKKIEQEIKLAEGDSLMAISALLPKASLKASHQMESFFKNLDEKSDVGLNLKMPLLDIKSQMKARSKKQFLISAKEKYLFEADSLINTVSTLYIDALIKQSEKDNAIFLKDQYHRQLLSLEKKFQVGSARSLDVVRAKYLVNKAHSDYLLKNQEFLFAMGELGKKISTQEFFLLSMINVESPYLAKAEEELLLLALDSYDIRVAERNLEAVQYSLLSERLDFFPKIDVTFSSDYNFPHQRGQSVVSKGFASRLIFNLELPLFSGGTSIAHIKKENAQKNLNQITLNQKRAAKKNDLYGLIKTIKDLKNIKVSAEMAFDAAIKAKDSAERLFNLKEATALELTEAKTDFVSSKNQLTSTTLKLEMKKIRLLFLIGKIRDVILSTDKGRL